MCETFFVLLLRVKTVPTLEPMFICTYMLPNPKHHLNWPRSSIEGLLSNEVFIKHVNTTKQVKQIKNQRTISYKNYTVKYEINIISQDRM